MMIVHSQGKDYEVHNTTDYVTIFNSTKITSLKEMKDFINKIKTTTFDKEAAINTRSIWSMLMEWRTYNMVHTIIPSSQTRLNFKFNNVVFEKNIHWWMELIYSILGLFYIHF